MNFGRWDAGRTIPARLRAASRFSERTIFSSSALDLAYSLVPSSSMRASRTCRFIWPQFAEVPAEFCASYRATRDAFTPETRAFSVSIFSSRSESAI